MAKSKPVGFDEWKVEITQKEGEAPVAEKLKVVRKNVKISEAEAESLNRLVLGGQNKYGVMYFPAE